MKNKSYWENINNITIVNNSYKETCEILIIGGGLSGLTLGYTLSKSFSDIIICDKSKLLDNTSSKSSSKITSMHNLMYQDICKIHGNDKAKLYFKAQNAGKNYLLEIIKNENIDCDLEQVTNYMYAKTFEGMKKLNNEIDSLDALDIKHNITNKVPLISNTKKTIKVKNDYMFHPVKYMKGIIDILLKKNIAIYEDFVAVDYKKTDYYYVYFANGRIIKAKYVIVCTGYPIFNPNNLYFSKLYQEKNYLLAFETNKNINNISINSDVLVRSLRYHKNNNKTIGIIVGNSHKSGDNVINKDQFKDLKNSVYEIDSNARIINTWSNQDVMSVDYLPFIGQYSKSTPNMYVVSAFHTWGMTNSHLAALIINDLILGKENIYTDLFNPTRCVHLNSLGESLSLISKAINGLIISRITMKKSELKKVKENTGAIVRHNGKCYAVFNNGNEYIFLKPTCPHTYCSIYFNDLEKTWDCRCHGSRFDIYGNIICGPAVKRLERVKIEIE